MKRSFVKKSISILLSLFMLLSVFGMLAVTVSAQDDPATLSADKGSAGAAQPDEGTDAPDAADAESDMVPDIRCGMCDLYEATRDIEYAGVIFSLVHFFIHLAALISYYA